jgi:hypothetical protein|tara:strand:- start:17308 stop:17583 length:276 start_codon:yes stop_codon:yes gene_type:complete
MVLKLIGFLSGFLLSSILDTTLGEFQEWAIVGTALIISSFEVINKIFYYTYFKIRTKVNKKYFIIRLLDILNFFKIGLIYGLIVDAFKLGS